MFVVFVVVVVVVFAVVVVVVAVIVDIRWRCPVMCKEKLTILSSFTTFIQDCVIDGVLLWSCDSRIYLVEYVV